MLEQLGLFVNPLVILSEFEKLKIGLTGEGKEKMNRIKTREHVLLLGILPPSFPLHGVLEIYLTNAVQAGLSNVGRHGRRFAGGKRH